MSHDMIVRALIAANGSTVLKLYYEAQEIDYKVQWIKFTGNEAFVEANEVTRKGLVDGPVSVTDADKAVTFDGYNYKAGFSLRGEKEVLSTDIAADGSTILKIFYEAIEVILNLKLGDSPTNEYGTWVGQVHDVERARADQTIELYTNVERPGYDFVGWASIDAGMTTKGTNSITVADALTAALGAITDPTDPANLDANGNVKFTYGGTDVVFILGSGDRRYTVGATGATLYAVWRARNDSVYTIEHYRVTGAGTLKEVITDTYTGITDDPVSATGMHYDYDANTGKTASNIPAFQGYAYSAGYSGEVLNGIVLADGSLVLKLYYAATPQSITINTGKGTWNDSEGFYGATWNADKTEGNATAFTESVLTVPSRTFATRDGYTLVGWTTIDTYDVDGSGRIIAGTAFKIADAVGQRSRDVIAWLESLNAALATNPSAAGSDVNGGKQYFACGNSFILPAGGATLYAVWQANTNTTYTVEHIKLVQNADGTITTKTELTESLTGITDETATGSAQTYAGYAFVANGQAGYGDPNYKTVAKRTILGDGTLVLKLYYTAKSDTPYTIERWLASANGTQLTFLDKKTATGTTDTTVAPTWANPQGYVLDNTFVPSTISGMGAWPNAAIPSAIIKGDGTTKIILFYVPDFVTYTVEFYRQTGDGQMIAIDAFTAATAPAGFTYVNGHTLQGSAKTSYTISVREPVGAVPQAGYAYAHLNFTSADYAAFTGYSFDELFDKTIDGKLYKTVATGTVLADGTLKLMLVYVPDTLSVTYETGTLATTVAFQKNHSSESTFTLPIEATEGPIVDRNGYTLAGWTTEQNFTFAYDGSDITLAVSDATGYKAEALVNALKAAGKFWAQGTSYKIGVTSVTLYAVWTPTKNTQYTADIYKIKGDGTMELVGTKTYTNGVADEDTNTLSTQPAQSSTDVYDHSLDAEFGLAGYSWVASTAAAQTINSSMPGNTIAHAVVNADGTTKLVFIFEADVVSFQVKRYRVDGDGNIIEVDINGNDITDEATAQRFTHTGRTDANVNVTATPDDMTGVDANNFKNGWYYFIDNLDNVGMVTALDGNLVAAFTYDATHGDNKPTGVIAGDGSLVLALYYVPGNFTFAVNPDVGTWSDALYEGAQPPAEGTLASKNDIWYRHFGASATIVLPKPNELTREGYVLAGWMVGNDVANAMRYTETVTELTYTMPVGDVQLNPVWVGLETAYVVYHVKVRGDGTLEYYTSAGKVNPEVGEIFNGTTGTVAQITANSYAGYEYIADMQSYSFTNAAGVIQTVTTAANVPIEWGGAYTGTNWATDNQGVTKVYLYYKPVIVKYKVEHWAISGDGTLYAIKADGTLERNGSSELEGSSTGIRIEHEGLSDSHIYVAGSVPADAVANTYVTYNPWTITGYKYVLGATPSINGKGPWTDGMLESGVYVRPDGTLVLKLYYVAEEFKLTYVPGADGTITADGNKKTDPVDITHRADHTFGLPNATGDTAEKITVERAGYKLAGWTTVATYGVAADGSIVAADDASAVVVKNIADAKGLEAEAVITWLATLAVDSNGRPVYYVNGATYLMPTNDKILYAVWAPRDDITYYVEHWLLSGDGTFSPLNSDGTVRRDANGALITGTPNTSANASDTTNAAYRVTYSNGKSDVVFDLDTIGGYMRTIAGYTYLLNNTSFTIEGATGTTYAVKTIAADGTTVFYLFYRANENTIRFEVGSLGTITGETDDGTTKYITQNHYTDDSFDLSTVPAPTRTGYTFKGWTIVEANGTDLVNDAKGATAKGLVTWLEGENAKVTGTYLKPFFKLGENFTYLAPTGNITLRAVWMPQTLTLNLETSGGTWVSGHEHANDQHMVESSFDLPTRTDITRPGYTLVGWSTSNPDDGLTEHIKGLASQDKANALAAIAGWITVATTADGKTYVYVTPGYTMPTTTQTLYAVWYANNDTEYTVERWLVSGDGAAYAIKNDGTVDRNGDGVLVNHSATESGYRITYTGTTDEEAWADGIDGSIVYRTNDSALSIAGYDYVTNGNTVFAKNGATEFVTYSKGTITGDGKLVLKLYFAPKQLKLEFYVGDPAVTSNLSAAPGIVTLYADQTFALPTSVTRTGYTFKGWTSWSHATSVDAATKISDLKGLKSQSAFDLASADATRDSATGKVFTAVAAPSYIMPTGSVVLHAVWRANDDTEYTVERWVVSGDGVRYAITSDGRLVRDGDGVLVSSPTADDGHVVKHVGVTDEEAWADVNADGISYRNNDRNLSFDGYVFAEDGTDILAKGGVTAYRTDARALITADGKMRLVLYFKPLQHTITFDFGSGTTTGTPAPTQVYTDETVNFSTGANRDGYELVGWSNVQTYDVNVGGAATKTTVNVGTSTGLASQAAADAAKANTTRTSGKGAAFTAMGVGGQTLDYIMPTAAQTLYAVWRAKSDTVYTVERWVVSGDGVLYAITSDGRLVRDGDGVLVSSPTADSGHVVKHVGVTDEEAWADVDIDGVSYRNNDGNLSFAGYEFVGHDSTVTIGGQTLTTQAKKIIAGDGSMVLRLYFKPKQFKLEFYVGDPAVTSNLSAAPGIVTLYADQTFALPTSVTRTGYTFKGWTSWSHATSVDAATKISDLKGLKSQSAFDLASADATRDSATGKVFTAVAAPSYIMPTGSVVLHAVWRANDDTPYYVSRWGINGDGVPFPFKKDGTIDMNGDELIIHTDPEWIKANYVIHYGVTDEEAWADVDVPGVSYRNADNIEVNGYRYLAPGDKAFGTSGLDTVNKGIIAADGTTLLTLYYDAKDNVTYYVEHIRVTGDGEFKNVIRQEIRKKNNTTVTADNLDHNGKNDSRFIGYEYVKSITVNGTPYTSSDPQTLQENMILYCYYQAIYDESDAGIKLELNPGEGVWVATDTTIDGTKNDLRDTYAPETTISLPGADQLYRPGYEFVGWSDVPDGATIKGSPSIDMAKHLMSVDPVTGQYTDVARFLMALFSQGTIQAAAGSENNAIEMEGDNPTYKFLDHLFIAPDGSFVIPTRTIKLHAVWRARTDTKYVVSHWWVDQYGVAHEIEDSRENLEGITDDTVSSSKLEDGHPSIAGYTYEKGCTGRFVLVQDTDENGNPLFDENGAPILNFIYQPLIDANGKHLLAGLELDNLNGDGTTHLRFYYTANHDTKYYVERWVITGDGSLVPLYADGTVPHDKDGNLIFNDEKWAEGQRLVYTGYTGGEAWADALDASVTYRHPDNIVVPGYTYLAHGKSVTIAGRTYTTCARAVIAGDGSTVLVLYYVYNETTLVIDPANGLWASSGEATASEPSTSGDGADEDAESLRKTLEQYIAEQIAAAAKAIYAAGGNVALDDLRRLPITFNCGTDAQIMLPTADQLKRNGYILIGFVDDNGKKYAPGFIYTMPLSNTKLLALWTPIIYTITFDKNDDVATGEAPDQRYEYGSADARLDAVAFERRNGKLIGWAFSPDSVRPDFTVEQLMTALLDNGVTDLVRGAGIDDPATAMYLLAAMANNNGEPIKLYAIWDVERHVAGLEGFEPEVDDFGHFVSEGEYPGGKIVIDSDGIEPGFTLSPDDVLIELNPGYYIKGWNVIRNGVVTYIEGADAIFSVTMDSDVTFAPVFGNEAEDRARLLGVPRTGDDGMLVLTIEFALGALAMIVLLGFARRRRSE